MNEHHSFRQWPCFMCKYKHAKFRSFGQNVNLCLSHYINHGIIFITSKFGQCLFKQFSCPICVLNTSEFQGISAENFNFDEKEQKNGE